MKRRICGTFPHLHPVSRKQMPFFQILGTVLTYVALILTVVSLIDYIVKNKDVLKDQK